MQNDISILVVRERYWLYVVLLVAEFLMLCSSVVLERGFYLLGISVATQ